MLYFKRTNKPYYSPSRPLPLPPSYISAFVGRLVQKLAALKKAYADIILNIAKEAAARILISERKTLRFQQDVFDAKEEALNMLLRLKKVMDSKVCCHDSAVFNTNEM